MELCEHCPGRPADKEDETSIATRTHRRTSVLIWTAWIFAHQIKDLLKCLLVMCAISVRTTLTWTKNACRSCSQNQGNQTICVLTDVRPLYAPRIHRIKSINMQRSNRFCPVVYNEDRVHLLRILASTHGVFLIFHQTQSFLTISNIASAFITKSLTLLQSNFT